MTRFVFCLTLLWLPVAGYAGSVKSMGSASTVDGPDGSPYLQASVNCASFSDDRLIWRKKSGGKWCSKVVADICSKSKINAAKKVCSREFNKALEEFETSHSRPAAAPAEAPVGKNMVEAEKTEMAVETQMKPKAESQPKKVSLPLQEPPAKQKPQLEPVAASEESTEQDSAESSNTAGMEEQQRQLDMERERLQIEQQRLELRKQQVELQKQELEIKRQMQAQEQPVIEVQKPARPSAPKEQEEQPASAVKKNVLGM